MIEPNNTPSPLRDEKAKAIAILSGVNLDQKNIERFGISYFTSTFNVVFYDMRRLLKRRVCYENLDRRYHGATVIEIDNIATLRAQLSSDKPWFAIDFVGDDPERGLIREVCKELNILFVLQATGNFPTIPVSNKIFFEVSTILSSSSSDSRMGRLINYSKSLSKRLINKIAMHWISMNATRVSPPDVALLSGRAALNDWTSTSKKIIWVPSQDTERFWGSGRENINESVLVDKIVFIDDDLPNSRDNSLFGIKPISPDNYYASMNNFFAFLDAKFNGEVVIASRHSADTEMQYERFNSRRCVKGKTLELIEASAMTIVHASTAVSYAVLARKPILIVTTNELLDDPYQISIDALAYSLRKKVINTSNSKYIGIEDEARVDENLWKLYEEEYLNYNNSNLRIWETLITSLGNGNDSAGKSSLNF